MLSGRGGGSQLPSWLWGCLSLAWLCLGWLTVGSGRPHIPRDQRFGGRLLLAAGLTAEKHAEKQAAQVWGCECWAVGSLGQSVENDLAAPPTPPEPGLQLVLLRSLFRRGAGAVGRSQPIFLTKPISRLWAL